jgi:hypothetical protein
MRMSSDAVDPLQIGAEWTVYFEHALAAAVAFRRLHGEVPCVDVQQADMRTDPVATVDLIYSSLGDELSETAAARMRAFADAHPRGRHGRHRYSLKRFGLDRESLRERFAEYTEMFGVEGETIDE